MNRKARTMPQLFELLETRYTSRAACAAALGISRQAYCQARTRRRLSERATIRAAALLNLDPGAALLDNATSKDPAPPELNPAPDTGEKKQAQPPALYYVKYDSAKDGSSYNAGPLKNVHCITSQSQDEAIDLIRWVLAVAGIPADSPRFAYYFSRWRIPDKVAAAKAAGTFADTIKNCPPIDPAWVRLIPAAMAEYHAFTTAHQINQPNKPASSGTRPPAGNRRRRAA